MQDRWVLISQKLPKKPVELSITNTKSTKTVIEMRAMETNKNFQYLQECMDWVNNQLVSDILDITSGFQTLHGFFALLTLHVALQFQVFYQNPDFP